MESIVVLAVIAFGIYKAFLAPPISTFSVQDRRFNNNIPEDFWRLLFKHFQISKRDVMALRYDGKYFYTSRKLQLSDVSHVTLRECGKVRVFDDTLPCSIRFKFSRIDGGPDRRYSYNWRIMECKKYIIKFHGKKSGSIRLYDLPHSSSFEPEALVKKVNRMLPILNHFKILEDINSYLEKTCKTIDIEEQRSILTRQRIEAMNVINSYLDLPEDVRKKELELELIIAKSRAKVKSIDSSLKALVNPTTCNPVEHLGEIITQLKTDPGVSPEIKDRIKIIKEFKI